MIEEQICTNHVLSLISSYCTITLGRNLIKIERKWADILGRLMKEASEHVRVTESKHRQQRRDMLQVTPVS